METVLYGDYLKHGHGDSSLWRLFKAIDMETVLYGDYLRP